MAQPYLFILTNFKIIDLLWQLYYNFNMKEKRYFYDNVNIYTVYGNFQFCIWDGGRIFFNYTQTSKEEMDFIINTYNKELSLFALSDLIDYASEVCHWGL